MKRRVLSVRYPTILSWVLNDRWKGFYSFTLIILLCIAYGAIFVLSKHNDEYTPSLFLTGFQMVLAGIMLCGYTFLLKPTEFTLKKEQIILIITIAFAGIYLCNCMEIWGSQFMKGGKASFLVTFCPISTAILSYIWLNEKINFRKILGLSLAALGYLPILISPFDNENSIKQVSFLSFAELAVLLACILSSVAWIATRRLIKAYNTSPIVINGISMIIGGLILLVHSYAKESWSTLIAIHLNSDLIWFLSLLIASNLIIYNLHAVLLQFYSATYLSLVVLIQPFLTALFGSVFLIEKSSKYLWSSILIVATGLYFYYREEMKTSNLKNLAGLSQTANAPFKT